MNSLLDQAGARLEVAIRVFGVDSAFDRGPAADDVGLLERQPLAGGDADLRLDQVDAGNHLGHGVLDLDAGVDLDEIEVVVLIDDELDGAGVGVADVP